MRSAMLFVICSLAALPGAFGAQQAEEAKDLRALEQARYAARMAAEARTSGSGENIDVTYYALDIAVDTQAQTVGGSVTMHARALSPVGSVMLDLINALTVDSVFMNGAAVAFQQDAATFTITLDRTYNTDEPLAAVIFYGGQPVSSGFGSFAFSTADGKPWVWTLSEPYGARGWWPCKDHPSDKADSVDVRITCPSELTAVSQGVLVSSTDNGDGTTTYHWQHLYPITTYLVSLAIAQYETFSDWYQYSPTDSMEVVNYLLPGYTASDRSNIALTPQALGVFAELFGEYPFLSEKYGHAEFGWGGGMEHQTIASMGGFSIGLITHELAHQWFGDMISPRSWRDIWLNEGFATYSVALYHEAVEGRGAYVTHMIGEMASARATNNVLYVSDTSTVAKLFEGSLVYAKGASVLHMLRRVLGDDDFFAALYAYANDARFRFGTATTEELQYVFEIVSGKDLSYFFTQWVYGERYPQYTSSWTAEPSGGGYSISLTVTQTTGTTNPAFFTMPIDLQFSNESADTLMTVWNSSNDTTYAFEVSFLPTQFQFDPDRWLLHTVVYLNGVDGGSVPLTLALSQNYPNPFNPGTRIEFFIPPTTNASGTDAHVTLKVFDLLGREVAALVNESLPYGPHAVTWDAGGVPSGVYVYRLSTGAFSTAKKMVLLK